ncbi:MAG: N-acetyltransferase [Bacteroidia bacterium]|nr:N-acetyltransferase [Bacteroidia bacterium]
MDHSLIIRNEKDGDFEAVSDVLVRAFEQEDESRLVKLLRQSDSFIPELTMVAEVNQNIVGSIVYSKIRIINDEGNAFQSIALAPMAVDPAFQKKGIGSILVKSTIAKAKELGYESIIVLGHAAYYPKFGFTEARPYCIKAPFDVPSEAFMVLELKEGILQDIEGTVQYNEAFSIL